VKQVVARIFFVLLGLASSLPIFADMQAYSEQRAAQQKNANKYWKENLKAQKKSPKKAQKVQKEKLKKAQKNPQAAF
jgi:hypothetical protein